MSLKKTLVALAMVNLVGSVLAQQPSATPAAGTAPTAVTASPKAPTYADLASFKIEKSQGVAFVTMRHGAMNLMDLDFLQQFGKLMRLISADEQVKVVVIKSAVPDYFMAHTDLKFMMGSIKAGAWTKDANSLHQMLEAIKSSPKVFIAQIEGRARGGGSEFAMGMDMSFAARGKAVLSQPEAVLGLVPGGGGTQNVSRKMGRQRALEVILSGQDYDADLAERYGYVNRAIDAKEIDGFVSNLAYKIASYPSGGIAAIKKSVRAIENIGIADGLALENRSFFEAYGNADAQARIQAFLEHGGQTPAGELADMSNSYSKHFTE